jgi:ADP-heptose:LPS heptosyltransferase
MHLLVIRTSAMGDVALVTPVLRGIRSQYPEIKITVLTRSPFEQFYYSINDLKVFIPDLRKRHKGFFGMIRLFRDLRNRDKIDHVIDLHDVLRSKILRLFFKLSGIPCTVIDKGRKEKRRVITGKKKVQLRHSVDRYCDVFKRAGFPVKPADIPCIFPSAEGISEVSDLRINKEDLNIGVAPYAKHSLKIWPEENMISLLELISAKYNIKVWLFGGYDEQERLITLQSKLPGSFMVTGKLSLSGEIALISRLDFMISMDSANMHIAALAGTKVISIWGGTDPMTGFGAWHQPDEFSIRIPVEELTCRPCTIYGKGKCKRGDFACMNWLTPERVYDKIVSLEIFKRRKGTKA